MEGINPVVQSQVSPVGGMPSGGQVPPPPQRNLKKPLLIVVGVLILAILGFLAYRFVLPMFGGGAREQTITWWGLWEDEAVVAPLIAEYAQANPKVKIEYVKQSPQDYRERLTNALAKGTGPDIFRFHNSWVPMFVSELDSLPPEVMSSTEFSQTFYPVILSDLTTTNGVVGLPIGFDTLALYINEEIFEKNGKSVPRTWDDLRQTAIELTIKDEKGKIEQAGVALGRTENVDHWQEILALMMLQNGVRMTNPTGNLAEVALTYYTIFSSVDGVWDKTLPPSTVAFANGKLAMYFAPSWRIFEIKNANPSLKFKVVPVPQLAKDKPTDPDVTYATYWVEGVWKRSENRQAAWNFLKFLSTQEAQQKLYQNATTQRAIGEPYPRVDMLPTLAQDPLAGAFVSQGGTAKSWYLASRTFDGPTGINTQINKYFEDAVNAVNSRTKVSVALEAVAAGVNQVLSQYGLAR